MSGGGYRRHRRRVVYENRWLRFEAHDIVHPNGQPGEHGVVATPAPSGVVVLDGANVVLARQPRYAADLVALEIVKGGAEPRESPRAAAERELREELGLAARRWDELGIVYEVPSIISEPVTLFLARDVTPADGEPEAEETIVAVRMPFAEAYELAANGTITDAVTVAALLRVRHVLSAERG